MKRIFISLLIVVSVGILATESSLNAFTTWFTRYGSQYVPVAMYADQDGHPYYGGEFGAMRRGGRTWMEVQTSYFGFYFGGWYSGGIPINDDKNQIIFDYLDPYVLGVTWLVTNGYNRECDHEFDIDTYWNMGPGPTSYNQIDFESVVVHEFGHNLGLGHSQYTPATMYAYMNFGDDSKRDLYWDDIDGLEYLYPSGPGIVSTPDIW
jgi:hypothetical protein